MEIWAQNLESLMKLLFLPNIGGGGGSGFSYIEP